MEGEAQQTFEQVAQLDAEFRAQQESQGFDRISEAAAIRELFASPELVDICRSKLGGRWGDTTASWAAWSSSSEEQLGTAIQQVVDDLDAPHLKPTGILERLQGGTDAACFGLATLVSKLRPEAGAGTDGS
eukprot:TRINITY_DN101827_c0_g1_i1.p1 TRINITY_DN101827_c0_g1~~TRINITY_DN101827_c0_g1_i1.p1  ORF type:complete len:146 (-),score=27.89 TRINITY_DN101827_c0_g1_i1:68-460(-)